MVVPVHGGLRAAAGARARIDAHLELVPHVAHELVHVLGPVLVRGPTADAVGQRDVGPDVEEGPLAPDPAAGLLVRLHRGVAVHLVGDVLEVMLVHRLPHLDRQPLLPREMRERKQVFRQALLVRSIFQLRREVDVEALNRILDIPKLLLVKSAPVAVQCVLEIVLVGGPGARAVPLRGKCVFRVDVGKPAVPVRELDGERERTHVQGRVHVDVLPPQGLVPVGRLVVVHTSVPVGKQVGQHCTIALQHPVEPRARRPVDLVRRVGALAGGLQFGARLIRRVPGASRGLVRLPAPLLKLDRPDVRGNLAPLLCGQPVEAAPGHDAAI